MTKLKPFPLLCLLLAILIQPLAAQTQPPSQTSSGTGYGIESETSYKGTMVLDLIAALEDEAVTAITEAYAEGYKAGHLASAPDTAYWRSLAEDWKAQAVAARSRPRLPWWAVPVSATAGIGFGFLVSLAMR